MGLLLASDVHRARLHKPRGECRLPTLRPAQDQGPLTTCHHEVSVHMLHRLPVMGRQDRLTSLVEFDKRFEVIGLHIWHRLPIWNHGMLLIQLRQFLGRRQRPGKIG